MSGAWSTTRAALQAQLNGLTVQVSGLEQETLAAYEYAVPGRQGAATFPYAYIVPVRPRLERHPGSENEYVMDEVRVRVMLAPAAQSLDMETMHKRYDAWWPVLSSALDDAVTADGGLDVFGAQEFEGIARFDDIDQGWGFEMVLRDAVFSAVATHTP